jgi:hypothetical protein
MKEKIYDRNNGVGYFEHCKQVNECKNTTCMFKQRDCFGVSVFYVDPKSFPEAFKKQMELYQKYGPWKYPKLKFVNGTNIIYIDCEDGK